MRVKSRASLGAAVAAALGWKLIGGDDFHLESSKAKMRMGMPLADSDRTVALAVPSTPLRVTWGG